MYRFLAGCLAILIACGTSTAQQPTPGLRDVVDPSKAAPKPAAASDAEKEPEKPAPQPDPMTLLFKRVSQLMMITLEGVNSPTASDAQILKTLPPGAIILPRVTRAETTAQYVRALRPLSAGAFESLPFLIGVDLFAQEQFADDARVSELRVPMMLTFAAAGPSPQTAAEFAVLAENVRTMGFDFHLGPSLALSPTNGTGIDIASIGTFGEDPAVCTALARQFSDAFASRNIPWLPLGYPGGSGKPAILLTPRSQLRDRDLAPFASVVNGGTRMINVGTALVPTIDSATPACFSPLVIDDLRGDVLGFKGLVVAGPLDSAEVKGLGKPEEVVVRALLAGADMFYWSKPGPAVTKAIAAVVDAVQKGAIDDALIEKALTHVREFKASLAAPIAEKEVDKSTRKFEDQQAKLSEPLAVERRAMTLIRNQGNALPLTEAGSQPTAVIGVYGAEELQLALEEYMKPIAMRSLNYARQAPRIEEFELNRILKISDAYRTIVCIVTGDLEVASQQKIIRSFRQRGLRVVAVVLGYPRDLAAVQDADAVLLTYGSTKRLNDTMAAVADILVGNAPLEILPPLRPLELRAGEPASFDLADVLRTPVGRLPVSFMPPFVAGYSVSYHPTLSVKNIHWDFGDGAKSKDAVTTHTYKKAGDYVVNLTVSSKKKETAVSGTFQVKVQ